MYGDNQESFPCFSIIYLQSWRGVRRLAVRAAGSSNRKPVLLECLIIGGGAAGACIAHELGRKLGGNKVMLLEKVSRGDPLYDVTCPRNVDSPGVCALVDSSYGFLATPGIKGISSLLFSRSVLHVSETLEAPHCMHKARFKPLPLDDAVALVPALRHERLTAAWLETCEQLDAVALRSGCIGGAKIRGVSVKLGAEVESATRNERDQTWTVRTTKGEKFVARRLINATGPQADDVAERCGIQPLGFRHVIRTCATFTAPADCQDDMWEWPTINLVGGVPASIGPVEYGLLGASVDAPVGATSPGLLAAKVEQWTSLSLNPVQAEASFRVCITPDGEPVIGADPASSSFIWACGLGSSAAAPAAARIVSAIVASSKLFARLGLRPGASPAQVRAAYRQQALACHPDTNPDDPNAGKRFLELRKTVLEVEAAADEQAPEEFPRDLQQQGLDFSSFSPARFQSWESASLPDQTGT